MHKRIGILGGLSPESTVSYYLHITRSYTERFGDYGYPEILIHSVNLEQFHRWRSAGRWDQIAATLAQAAEGLREAGAEVGVIATNTMHKVFDEVQAQTRLPLLHIIDVMADSAQSRGFTRLGLLGTCYTMSDGFFQQRLAQRGLTTLTPSAPEQEIIHGIIVNELVRGKMLEGSRQQYLSAIDGLVAAGAEAIVLGCTEIPLLISQDQVAVLLLDTAILHAEAALAWAIVRA